MERRSRRAEFTQAQRCERIMCVILRAELRTVRRGERKDEPPNASVLKASQVEAAFGPG